MIETKDCLTAFCLGFDFVKPKFTLSKYFDDILDVIHDVDKENVDFNIEKHRLILRLADLKIIFGPKKISIISNISIRSKIMNAIVGENNENIALFNFWGDSFKDVQTSTQEKVEHSKFIKSFPKNAASILDLISAIVKSDIPNLRFLGYVEFYLIPIDYVKWSKLDEFDVGASISKSYMTEKTARNRYRFINDDTFEYEDQKSLIFHMHIPEENQSRANYAGTSFDFQYWPQKEKSLFDYGEPKQFIKYLQRDLSSKLEDEDLLKLEIRRGAENVGSDK
ncbi:MAG: hypothetical protein ACOCP4_06095 [Candidatus Woesearchaeota archaeon]